MDFFEKYEMWIADLNSILLNDSWKLGFVGFFLLVCYQSDWDWYMDAFLSWILRCTAFQPHFGGPASTTSAMELSKSPPPPFFSPLTGLMMTTLIRAAVWTGRLGLRRKLHLTKSPPPFYILCEQFRIKNWVAKCEDLLHERTSVFSFLHICITFHQISSSPFGLQACFEVFFKKKLFFPITKKFYVRLILNK